ncbi:MAG: hypothetical protein KGQ30_11070, partial [Burkholderiales bacterium]|nr:hypothetical protein [Burkholderiales bacterium]
LEKELVKLVKLVIKATLNKPARCSTPWIGMGCKAQTTAIAAAIARVCNAADRPEPGMRRARGACSALPKPAIVAP